MDRFDPWLEWKPADDNAEYSLMFVTSHVNRAVVCQYYPPMSRRHVDRSGGVGDGRSEWKACRQG